MIYANPNYLPIVVGASLFLAVFYLWVARRRAILTERFAEKRLLGEITPSRSLPRKVIKALFIITALSLMTYALARPQWGFEWEEVRRSGLDMLIAIDVSKSMLATDVKPNRLERSKFAVKDIMKKLNGDRVGLVAFAGTAFLQCPLTIDYNGFLLSLDDLNPGIIPRGGTSIASAIREAVETFKGADKKYKVLVIITDGEELEDDAANSAKLAAEAGIKIYCVGVGTADGELIPFVNEAGVRGYMTDRHGDVVKTKLNEELLKTIAIATGGSYVRATQAEFGLSILYDKSISKLEKRDIESKMRKHYQERFQCFLWPALVLLLLEPLIAARKRAA